MPAITNGAQAKAKEINPKRGHRRICSKTYAKGSGMIPCLDFAVSIDVDL
jgi:hypothetical protein